STSARALVPVPSPSDSYTLSLHDALPISSPNNKVLIAREPGWNGPRDWIGTDRRNAGAPENRSAPITLQAGSRYYVEALHKEGEDRKSTRLNSSHEWISYAVFCLKKKKKK